MTTYKMSNLYGRLLFSLPVSRHEHLPCVCSCVLLFRVAPSVKKYANLSHDCATQSVLAQLNTDCYTNSLNGLLSMCVSGLCEITPY